MRYEHNRGFTLIEVLVSISIIALLSSVILSATNSARRNARDSKRIASIRELQIGLEIYLTSNHRFPDSDNESGHLAFIDLNGKWDTPRDGDFLKDLVDSKSMQGHVFDPLGGPGSAEQDNLRYYRYPAGAFGCPESRGAFYVLGIVDMETSKGTHPLSPNWTCGTADFGEFEFVVGGFED